MQEQVRLVTNSPIGLRLRGAIGTIIKDYGNGWCEVEFKDHQGRTLTNLLLNSKQYSKVSND